MHRHEYARNIIVSPEVNESPEAIGIFRCGRVSRRIDTAISGTCTRFVKVYPYPLTPRAWAVFCRRNGWVFMLLAGAHATMFTSGPHSPLLLHHLACKLLIAQRFCL